jgi:hypothetical protein
VGKQMILIMFFAKISFKSGTVIVQSPHKMKYSILRDFAKAVARKIKDEVHFRYHTIHEGYEEYFFDLIDSNGNLKEYIIINSLKDMPTWYIEKRYEYLGCEAYEGIMSQNPYGVNKVKFTIHLYGVQIPLSVIKELLFVDTIEELQPV